MINDDTEIKIISMLSELVVHLKRFSCLIFKLIQLCDMSICNTISNNMVNYTNSTIPWLHWEAKHFVICNNCGNENYMQNVEVITYSFYEVPTSAGTVIDTEWVLPWWKLRATRKWKEDKKSIFLSSHACPLHVAHTTASVLHQHWMSHVSMTTFQLSSMQWRQIASQGAAC